MTTCVQIFQNFSIVENPGLTYCIPKSYLNVARWVRRVFNSLPSPGPLHPPTTPSSTSLSALIRRSLGEAGLHPSPSSYHPHVADKQAQSIILLAS